MCYGYWKAIFKNFDFDRFTIDTKTLDSAHAL